MIRVKDVTAAAFDDRRDLSGEFLIYERAVVGDQCANIYSAAERNPRAEPREILRKRRPEIKRTVSEKRFRKPLVKTELRIRNSPALTDNRLT